MKKRILSGLLTVAILASLLPSKVIVAEAASDKGYESHLGLLYTDGQSWVADNKTVQLDFKLDKTTAYASGTYNMFIDPELTKFWVAFEEDKYYGAKSIKIRDKKDSPKHDLYIPLNQSVSDISASLKGDSDSFHLYWNNPQNGISAKSDVRLAGTNKFVASIKQNWTDWLLPGRLYFGSKFSSGNYETIPNSWFGGTAEANIAYIIGHGPINNHYVQQGKEIDESDDSYTWDYVGTENSSSALYELCSSIPERYSGTSTYVQLLDSMFSATDSAGTNKDLIQHVYTVGRMSSAHKKDESVKDVITTYNYTTSYVNVVCTYDIRTGMYYYLIVEFMGFGDDDWKPDASLTVFQSPVLYRFRLESNVGGDTSTARVNSDELENRVEYLVKESMKYVSDEKCDSIVLPSADYSAIDTSFYSKFVKAIVYDTINGYKGNRGLIYDNLLYNLRYYRTSTDNVEVQYRSVDATVAIDNNCVTFEFGDIRNYNGEDEYITLSSFKASTSAGSDWEDKLLYGNGAKRDIAVAPTEWESLMNAYLSGMSLQSDDPSKDYPWVDTIKDNVVYDGNSLYCGLPERYGEAFDIVARTMAKLDTLTKQKDLLEKISGYKSFSLDINKANDSFDWRTMDEISSTPEYDGTIKVNNVYEALFVLASMEMLGVTTSSNTIKVSLEGTEFEVPLSEDVATSLTNYASTVIKLGDETKGDARPYKLLSSLLLEISEGQKYALQESIRVSNVKAESYTGYIISTIMAKSPLISSESCKALGLEENEQLDMIRTELNEHLLQDEFVYMDSLLAILPHCYYYYMYSVLKVYGTGREGEALVVEAPQYEAYLKSNKVWDNQYLKDASGEVMTDTYIPRLPVLKKGYYVSGTEAAKDGTAPATGTKTEMYPSYPTYVTVALGTIDYAFQNADWSTYAEENGVNADAIQEWLSSGNAENIEAKTKELIGPDNFITAYEWAQSGVHDNTSLVYMQFFRAIVNIHKLCDMILETKETTEIAYVDGDTNVYKKEIVQEWSPVIEKYYNLYENNRSFFEAIERSLTIYTDSSMGVVSELEPFGSMFTISKGSEMMMSDWKKGFALSSLYVPMSTNLYNSESVSYLQNDEWTMEFYYRYGFYRKALYVSTDPDCIVNKYVSGANSSVKVATLGDLLNYDRDIELFVDSGFYNSDTLKDELTNYITHSGENSGFTSLSAAHAISDIERIVKDGSYRTYSAEVASNVMPFTEEGDVDYTKYPYDAYLLSREDILGNDEGYNGVLKDYDYSVRQSYGAVSSIYRSNTLFNKAQSLAAQSLPVFRSSKNICKIEGVHTSQYRCFYNYLALASLDNLIAKNTTLVLDEDAPIFMDIFGNIVTETGLIIIPASANATLLGEYFTPYSVGYATFVNNVEDDIYNGLPVEFYTAWCGSSYEALIKDGSIAKDSVSKEQYRRLGLGYFTPRENGFSLTNTVISDGAASIDVVWSTINTNAENLRSMLFSRTYMAGANMYTSTMINIILEVLRGAPIENIDYAKEGLEVVPRADEMGVYAAYKLENLIKMLHTDSDGTPKFQMSFSILDVFHIAAAERVAAISVKVFLVGALVLLFIQIIVQASEGRMPWRAAKQVISGACLVGLTVALVPSITNWTYTSATSALLQREAASLLMLSQDRKSTGVEIGVLSMNTPRETTHLVTKIGELDVAWYDSLLYAVGTPMMASFEDMYKEAAATNILAQQEHVFMSGKDIYADLGSILDSTRLMYNPATGILTNVYVGDDKSNTSLSYLTPYYVILDQLVANVNKYNLTNSVAPLSWSIGNDGAIVTTDMIAPYLQSVEFLDEGYDVLGMTHILDASGYASQYAPIFNDSQIDTMRRSAWYPELKSAEEKQEISDELIAKARYFASSYSDYYGLISDSTFLKAMAMYLAIEFNAMADIDTFNTFELKCIDTQDLLRYICGEPDDLFRYYKHSFARYVYNVSELPGVILGALLWLVFSLTNCCRVLSFVITCAVAVVSIVYHKIIKKEEDFEIYGYAIMTGAVTLLNVVYALVLKVELNLTSWGVAPLIAMVIAIITQIIYAIATMGICWIQLKNWKTLNSVVAHVGNQIVNTVNNLYSNSAQDKSKARKSTGGGASERTYEALVAHDFNRREGNIK